MSNLHSAAYVLILKQTTTKYLMLPLHYSPISFRKQAKLLISIPESLLPDLGLTPSSSRTTLLPAHHSLSQSPYVSVPLTSPPCSLLEVWHYSHYRTTADLCLRLKISYSEKIFQTIQTKVIIQPFYIPSLCPTLFVFSPPT